MLDLGAGLGLCGIALAKRYKCHVKLSDFDDRVIARCEDNVMRNRVNSCVDVVKLDWSESKGRRKSGSDLPDFDLIISADTIYDPSLLPNLVDTILLFLTGSSRFILSTSIRNLVTCQKFLALLSENDLGVREIRMTASWFYYDEQANLLRLFEVIKA